jgi:hypothetical protein
MATFVGFWTWRQQRRSGYVSWYHGQWKKVDRKRRRRIARSVRRGEAVADPRDAALALELIDAQRRLTRDHGQRRRWIHRVHYVLLALLAVSVVLTRADLKLAVFALLPIGYLLVMQLFVRRLQARVASAREKNEQLVGRFS